MANRLCFSTAAFDLIAALALPLCPALVVSSMLAGRTPDVGEAARQ